MKSMAKILMINTVYFRGGAAGIAQTLHNALNETSEFSSFFAYGRGPKMKNERTFKFAFPIEVYVHAFLTRATGLQGDGTYFSTKRLERFILKEKFDLIHLHNLHGYYLDLSFIKFLGKLNVPFVWTLHDGWSITGRCAYLFECNRWKTGCGNCPNLSWYPKTYFDSSAFMWKKKKEVFNSGWNPVIVCPSQWLANKIRESYLNKFQIEIIPNGIDTELFKPKDKIEAKKKFGLSLSKKIILFVANKLKDERKGVKYFLEALNHIKSEDWQVLILGPKLKLKESDKIKQLGHTSDADLISEVYNAADIFCITSLDETFGLTVTEAMACGIPAVGFKTGGITEQVSANCGILVEPKNVKNLAEAINMLLNNDEKRKTFSLNCRKRVLENYSIEKFKERYINLYKKILK